MTDRSSDTVISGISTTDDNYFLSLGRNIFVIFKLCGLKTVKLEGKKDEKTGRMQMVEVPGSESKLDCDLVLIAAGFLGTEDYIAKAFGVDLNARTNVATEAGHYKTNVENVFTAGDMHRGQSLVVWAIREGREAAREVDESLMGYSYLSVQ